MAVAGFPRTDTRLPGPGDQVALAAQTDEYGPPGVVVRLGIPPLRVLGHESDIGVAGKSPGEIALHDPVRGILVVGDAVIGNPPGALSFLPDRVVDDPAQLRKSVRALIELEFDALIVGDGVSILEGAKAKLQELVGS